MRLARQLQAFSRLSPPRVQRLDTHQALALWLPFAGVGQGMQDCPHVCGDLLSAQTAPHK